MQKLGILFAVLSCALLTAGIASSATIVVPTDQPTIQDAVYAANDGDLIQLLPGTYNETVNVIKSVTINGKAGKYRTFVVSPAAGNNAFWVTANNAILRGITVRGGTGASGILINASRVKVINCTVEKSAFGIVIGDGGSHTRLISNQIRYCTAMSGVLYPNLVIGTGVSVVSTFGGDITDVYMGHNQINDNDQYGVWAFGYHSGTSYDGMTLEFNTLVNNGSDDLLGPSNYNRIGFLFENALGTITLNSNQVLATSIPGQEIAVVGPNTPTFKGSGNQVFPNFTVSMAGTGTNLALP